jgi:putative DNA primase/helicase
MTIDDKDRQLFIYGDGVFQVGGETIIDTDIETYYPEESSIRFRKEVLEKIKIKTLTDRDKIDADDNIKNLRSGLFNIETGVETPHRPNYKSIVQLNVNYNKNAKCLKIFKFLKDVILEDKERLTVLEMIAELLWRESTLTKSYFLLGFGSNGKSTLRDIVLTMLGMIHNADLPFEDLSDKYKPAELDGTLVNFPDEIDDTKIVKSATWKSTTSKKSINAQRKFGHPFSFIWFGKHIMPCNQPPQIDDKSDGTYRRIVPIHFDQIFDVVLTPQLKQQGHKAVDEKFVNSLLDNEEISGLFNTLVLVVRQLKKRKHLTFGLTVKEVRNEWETITNTTKSFINSKLILDEKGVALKTDYYRAFVRFCTEKGFKIDGINTFYANFQKEGAIDKKARLTEKSSPQHCFSGYWFKDTSKETVDDDMQSTL